MIVLVQGDKRESLELRLDRTAARRRLRTLDAEIQGALMRLARPERTVYLTIGHGELNDPETRGPLAATALRQVKTFEAMLARSNYLVTPLGLKQGLGREVPLDAAIVVIAGPRQPLLDAEVATLDRYLQRGGAVLIALDPEGASSLGGLEQRLGFRFSPVPLADETAHLVAAGNPSDRRLLLTDQFSAHASATTLSRARGASLLFAGAGALEVIEAIDGGHPSVVVRSPASTFADVDGDFQFDPGPETKRAYALVGATEGPRIPPGAERPMRAIVLADAELLSDALLEREENALFVHDAVQWLGGEERYAGTTSSEKDAFVKHTRSEDVLWFYSTILGAPSLLLALGLVVTRRRRRAHTKHRDERRAG
jgi:hypothetical protein